MKVRGWSVSVSDGIAAAGIVAGVVFTLIGVARSVGDMVFASTGSLWLATCAWVLAVLVDGTMIGAGFAWILTDSRTYRHPEERVPHVERAKVSSK